MTSERSNSIRSEKGVALITVLLLLAVVSALTTALAMSGQTEIAMASNEMYYAGARAAAEAGLNRAAEHLNDVNTLNLLAGADNAVDPGNAAAAVNADNGLVPTIGNGPFTLSNQYSYTLQILDDDDPSLYPTPLSAAQLAQMNENGVSVTSLNDRLILRAVGIGPRNTRVVVQRVLQSVAINNITTTTTTTISDPAILVNGDLSISGNMTVGGSEGNVHANGDVTGSGNAYLISGDLTATGDLLGNVHANGLVAADMPPINVPEIKASDFLSLADWILTDSGTIVQAGTGTACGGKGPACPTGWSFSGGTWSASGSMPSSATYYVQGDVSIHGTGKSAMTSVSVIAEGSITLTGNGKFRPENNAGIQFVTNGDFSLGGTVDADDTIDMDGQIMVREQMDIFGNSEFQGRVMVENRDGSANAYDASTNPNGRRGSDQINSNQLRGNMRVTYNGGLGEITSVNTITTTGPTTYTNNISGWIES